MTDISERLRGMLSEKRYIHSLGVAQTAMRLALHYGADAAKAHMAGLVHDAAKDLTLEEMLGACRRLGVQLDETELKNPSLIHAPLGAEYITEQFGIDDREIKNAVRYHTTGRAGMSMLERIIYLADIIEPSRDFEGVLQLRTLGERDIDAACIAAAAMTIRRTLDNNQLIHPNTLYARNDLLLKKWREKERAKQ